MLKNIDYDIKSLENDTLIPTDSIYNYRFEYKDPIPLLYQSGYLTIKSSDENGITCMLGFPNEEVKYGFYSELLPVYMGGKHNTTEFYAANFVRDLQDSNVEGFMTRLRAFFADIPNVLENKREKHYHTIFFVLFRLMGQFVEAEYNSAVGRADAVVVTKTTVYVFEFKMSGNGTAEDALQQIDDKKYMLPFTASGKQLVKIGVEFSDDKDERNVARWVVG
jgi:hypothetical protein